MQKLLLQAKSFLDSKSLKNYTFKFSFPVWKLLPDASQPHRALCVIRQPQSKAIWLSELDLQQKTASEPTEWSHTGNCDALFYENHVVYAHRYALGTQLQITAALAWHIPDQKLVLELENTSFTHFGERHLLCQKATETTEMSYPSGLLQISRDHHDVQQAQLCSKEHWPIVDQILSKNHLPKRIDDVYALVTEQWLLLQYQTIDKQFVALLSKNTDRFSWPKQAKLLGFGLYSQKWILYPQDYGLELIELCL
ncbi:MAG: hypothetical protein EAZ57_11415 [Cytophagales bacterium]|nr:MAG: hypothetical protein EAZ67_12350 [Cytophagales bacterium]TAF59369.1 MAG: hypothetical protein EAZ57_11415 [Cytophagales bacterium]